MDFCHICDFIRLLAVDPSQADHAMVGLKEERGSCLCVLYTTGAFSNSRVALTVFVYMSLHPFISEGWGTKGRCAFLIGSPAVTPPDPPPKTESQCQ